MYHHGGLRPFFAGTWATVGRDMLFGGCFAVIRHGLMSHEYSNSRSELSNKMIINGFAGFIATIASSPLNYVRNIHYATDPSVCHTPGFQILRKLWIDSKQTQPRTFLSQLSYLQQQLRIGWGTARVACGMALGAQIYDTCAHHMKSTKYY